MNTVEVYNRDGTIKRLKFSFRGMNYEITGTGTERCGTPVWLSRDLIRREDGRLVTGTRHILRDYFLGVVRDNKTIQEDFEIILHGKQ